MRPRQTLLLGLLLLLPVLAFLFLYGFGSNHYALPTYLPERVDSVRIAGGGWQRDTVYHWVRPFRLLAAGDRYVSSQVLSQGQGLCVAQLIASEPTSAQDAQATREMMRVQEKFRREPRVRLATLVATADTAKAKVSGNLQKLSEQYGTISGKWFVLGATPDTIQRLARYEFGLTALQPQRLPFRPATEPATLSAGRLLLIDDAQHVRGIYDGTDIHEIERLITEINVLLYTYDHRH
jgi:protein SCO1/2